MQLKKLVIVFISISLCLSSQATFIPLTVQEIDGSPSVTKVKNITFNGATLTDLLNGRVLVTVSSAATAAGSTGAIQFNNSNALGANSTNLFWDDTNNRLGIGTNSPTSTLTLSDSTYTIGLLPFTSGGSNALLIRNATNTGAGNLEAGATQVSTLRTTSNVGIGTAPVSNVQLQSSAASSITKGLVVQAAASQTANLTEWQNGGGLVLASISNNGTSSFNSIKSNKSMTIAASTAYPLEIMPGYPGNYDEHIHFILNGSTKMFINSTGITSVGDIYTWQNKLIRPYSHGNSFMGFTNGGTFSQDTISLNGWQKVQIGTNSSPVINITASANVGIGTTSPARKLHVSEAMRLEPQVSPPGTPSLGDIYVDSSEAVCVYVDGAWSKIAGSGTCL